MDLFAKERETMWTFHFRRLQAHAFWRSKPCTHLKLKATSAWRGLKHVETMKRWGLGPELIWDVPQRRHIRTRSRYHIQMIPVVSRCIQCSRFLQGRSRAGIFITFHIYHILDWIVCCRSSKDAFMNHLRGREDILSFWVLMFNMSSVPSEQSLLASSHPETWHGNDYNILYSITMSTAATDFGRQETVSFPGDRCHSQ